MEYDTLKQPDRITHEYNMLMSSMHVSVGKHLLDPYFTVSWANDFFMKKRGMAAKSMKQPSITMSASIIQPFPTSMKPWGNSSKRL